MAKFVAMRIQDANKVNDEKALKIFGVRIAKFLPEGWVHRNGTSPSSKLLFKAKDLEKKGEWNKISFQTHYLPFFLNEIKLNPEAKNEFYEIIKHLEDGNNVYYACYCSDGSICHRSIIAELVKRKGFNTEIH